MTAHPRQALLIGNDAYAMNSLPCCISDANQMNHALGIIGFHTYCGKDLKSQPMKYMVDRFVRSIQPGSIVVFYYSGHGIQLNGVNYLVPIDNDRTTDPNEMTQRFVNVQKLINDMYAKKPKLVITILDACRSDEALNDMKRLSVKTPTFARPGLAAMYAPPGTIIAYACGADQVSYGKSKYGNNSVYTYHLLRYIATPNTDIDVILRKVATEVQKETRNEQTPFRYSSFNEIFCLVPQKKSAPAKPSREYHRPQQHYGAFQLPVTKFTLASNLNMPGIYRNQFAGQMRFYR